MNMISRFFVVGLLMFVWSVAPALAQKRIALVIGNSKYTSLQSLPNPGNDSRLMAKTLRRLGFDVISASDVDFIGMRRAVKKFGRKLRSSGKDAVGLFYYAGHGVQAQGANFLVPLGAEISDEADLEIETIAASDVLAQMEAAGNTLNLIILDACRNNPFKGKIRSSSRGLARLNAASGSLVAFAAAPGQVAADGSGDNSPYTKALVTAMQVPGLSVEQMFKRVRISVEEQTNKQQTPWEESSLRGDFFFTPKNELPKLAIGDSGATVDIAAREWVNVQNVQSVGVLKAFIKRHPTSIYAEYARVILEEKGSTAIGQKKQQPDQVKQQQVASLQAASKDTLARTQPPSPRELTLQLQHELTRVGCNPGRIDGQWGAKGRRALARFKRYAKLKLPTRDISIEVIDTVKQHPTRVCPKVQQVKVKKAKVGKTKRARKARRKKLSRKEWCIKNAKEFDGVAADWC